MADYPLEFDLTDSMILEDYMNVGKSFPSDYKPEYWENAEGYGMISIWGENGKLVDVLSVDEF